MFCNARFVSNTDIRTHTNRSHCTNFRAGHIKEIETDIFHFDDKNYLATIEYHSRLIKLYMLPDTRAATVFQRLQVHMSRYGIVDVCHMSRYDIVDLCFSDNRPKFALLEFAECARHWNVEYKISAPLYDRSNRFAEKGNTSKSNGKWP